MLDVRSRRLAALALATTLGALAGCGDDGTGPSGPGALSAVLVDSPAGADGAGPSGTFEATVRVEVSEDGEGWQEVAAGAPATVELQSDEPIPVADEVEIPGGDYRHVRVRITGAAAELDAGSVLGGEPLAEDVRVVVADGGEVAVEREIFSFRVDPATAMTVVVDVRSGDWVTAAAAAGGSVPAAEFRASVRVEARRT